LGAAAEGDPYVMEFFRELKERPWCRYDGFADRAKLKTYFKRAAALALPSLEDNCPMAVLEAMAAGVPVLAAEVGGVPDLIEKRRTGLLCDPHDAASMCAAMGELVNDSSLRKRLAEEARIEARRRFHPLAIAERHVEIYREMLNARS
jgi:glycosyltransferase involved in cell wall biosynthesis